MMVTGVSGLASRNFVSLVDNTDIKWANMTTAEKFLHILSLGIWSPEVPEEARQAFTTWMKDVLWQVQADTPDSVSSTFMDITVTYYPNTREVVLSDNNTSTLVNHKLPAKIYRILNAPSSHDMADVFLEKHGNGFRSEDTNAVREVVTDIFRLQSLSEIKQMMDKVRELQQHKNNDTSLSVKMDVSDETTTVTLLINGSPFKHIIGGENVSDYLNEINLSGISLKGSNLAG
ncbi:hypothetical protein C2D16_24450, partial [Escherichia coli]|nr:hypothetical protein [Escherichia coli]